MSITVQNQCVTGVNEIEAAPPRTRFPPIPPSIIRDCYQSSLLISLSIVTGRTLDRSEFPQSTARVLVVLGSEVSFPVLYSHHVSDVRVRCLDNVICLSPLFLAQPGSASYHLQHVEQQRLLRIPLHSCDLEQLREIARGCPVICNICAKHEFCLCRPSKSLRVGCSR